MSDRLPICEMCRSFPGENNFCPITARCCGGDHLYEICFDFEQKSKLTNGDIIRQMDDEDLAKVLTDGCPPFGGNSYKCKHPNPDFTCKDCWREWLNAPAESEGDDE